MNYSMILSQCLQWMREEWSASPLRERTSFRTCGPDELENYILDISPKLISDNDLYTYFNDPDELAEKVIILFWEELHGI